MIKAIREGKPLIWISIHELQSSALEFMNELLDRKYDDKQGYLNNPNESTIPISHFHCLNKCSKFSSVWQWLKKSVYYHKR